MQHNSGISKNTAPGIPCPECHFPIRPSIQELLFKSQFCCPGCGLVLQLDRSESRRSLELLQQLHIAMTNAEKAREQQL